MNFKTTTLFILVVLSQTFCMSQEKVVAYSSDNLKVIALSENSYVHISFLKTKEYGKVACNGLVYLNDKQALVIDTPVDQTSSLELIQWITEQRDHRLHAVVANHFHRDCLGGLKAFHQKNITSYANNATLSLAKERGSTVPQNGFDNELRLEIGKTTVINRFLGPAHTSDNIITYLPEEELLYGGCMVKSMNASKGNLADANVEQWGTTIEKIRNSYPDLKIVVPGHGPSGGMELLDYTEKLFERE
ncbi:subclass B1 metallo-beta-lactamase [Pelagihabitans pacificus]